MASNPSAWVPTVKVEPWLYFVVPLSGLQPAKVYPVRVPGSGMVRSCPIVPGVIDTPALPPAALKMNEYGSAVHFA